MKKYKIFLNLDLLIAVVTLCCIGIHLFIALDVYSELSFPLLICFIFGGIPILFRLLKNFVRLEFNADLLAGISIVVALILEQYLASAIVILMLSGGESIEYYAKRKASSLLEALARRLPEKAFKKTEKGVVEVDVSQITVSDLIEVPPHSIVPVDGNVIEGRGYMDESFLTGEPYKMLKTVGNTVISGALNGETRILIQATKIASESRYAKILKVVEDSENKKPKIRRLADKIGGFYTPFALVFAGLAWYLSGDSVRFLSVLVVATPCPLLIAVPVAIIGAISLSARKGIIIKDPTSLELIGDIDSVILDKTGTLTYGTPELFGEFVAEDFKEINVLQLVASVERYSKHPLAEAIIKKATDKNIAFLEVNEIEEKPGSGLLAQVGDKKIQITSRKVVLSLFGESVLNELPEIQKGLECVILIDSRYAATYQFVDKVREDSPSFLKHLRDKHSVKKLLMLSGDKEQEVSYLAGVVGIKDFLAEQSPEDKLKVVLEENKKHKTLFIGDGINDAPALSAAHVGIAVGFNSEITSESAGVVILDSSLKKIDYFIHISMSAKKIALQSAVSGMLLSVGGMFFAAFGFLTPVYGALLQEIIDILVVFNALRVTFLDSEFSDY